MNDHSGDSRVELVIYHDGTSPVFSSDFENRTSFGLVYSFIIEIEDDHFPVSGRIFIGAERLEFDSTGTSFSRTFTLEASSFTRGWHDISITYWDSVGNQGRVVYLIFADVETAPTTQGVALPMDSFIPILFCIGFLGLISVVLRGRAVSRPSLSADDSDILSLVKAVILDVGVDKAIWESTLAEEVLSVSRDTLSPRGIRVSLKSLVEKGYLRYAEDGISLYLPE
ncbi:MAG: hypothetical protein P1Q69_01945 [Candidatus Thorarchaeota archaeon]|nr:hypothetical protein [Candidatus Thorarchaeota archaeon]